MNDHIKSLLAKAHLAVDNPKDTNQIAETFAMLIVNECLIQCEQHFAGAVGTYAGAHNSAIKKCTDSIKQHFGCTS